MANPIRLIAKQQGNLLSVVINREINIDQAHLIDKLLDLTDGEGEANAFILEVIDGTLDMALEVRERPPSNVLLPLLRREGIEQFQAEDR